MTVSVHIYAQVEGNPLNHLGTADLDNPDTPDADMAGALRTIADAVEAHDTTEGRTR